MAGASDKARFYLEKYVPELREYERKQIFSLEEIKSIASKRSDFEHILNARGSKPSDYARYATYEMNLDSLRKKRCKRVGVQSTAFSGHRTIFFILDRATKKFPGDMGLWMQHIHFCQRERANKKLGKVFTQVLRLKPREWGLWVLAAKHYAESQGDVRMARAYMQRGLRFCGDQRRLWVEYSRLEMVYLAKLAARRKILGLDEARKTVEGGKEREDGDEDEDIMMLPVITAEDVGPDATKEVENVDEDALKKLASAPAFTGAIPIAVFDAAMKQFKDNAEVAEDLFDVVASFDQVPSSKRLLEHILDHMRATSADSVETMIVEAKSRLLGVDGRSAEFPTSLGASLAAVKKGQTNVPSKAQRRLAEKAMLILLPYLKAKEEIDEDVVRVLEASVRRYLRQISKAAPRPVGGEEKDAMHALLERLRRDGRDSDAAILEEHWTVTDLG